MANRATLDESLAKELAGLLVGTKHSAVELARRAATLKADFFDESAKRYDSAFKTFWQDFGMTRRFGTLANFTKYANAGIAISRIPPDPSGDDERYPTSLLALYEMSMLTPEELALCLENTYARNVVTDDRSKWQIPEPANPLIAPATTARAISKWRRTWREPDEAQLDAKSTVVARVRLRPFVDGDEAQSEMSDDELLAEFWKLLGIVEGQGAVSLEIVVEEPVRFTQRTGAAKFEPDDGKWGARIEKAFAAELAMPTKKLRFSRFLGRLLLDLGFSGWSISGYKQKKGRVERGGFIDVRPSDYRLALAEEYLKIYGSRAFLIQLYRHDRLDPALLSEQEREALIDLEPRYREVSKITSALRKPQNAGIREGIEHLDKMEAEVAFIETALPEKISHLTDTELDELAASYVPNIAQYGWRASRPKFERVE